MRETSRTSLAKRRIRVSTFRRCFPRLFVTLSIDLRRVKVFAVVAPSVYLSGLTKIDLHHRVTTFVRLLKLSQSRFGNLAVLDVVVTGLVRYLSPNDNN